MTDAASAVLAEVDRLGGTLVLLADGTPVLRAPKDPAKRRALAALSRLLSQFREEILSSLPGPEPEPEREPTKCPVCSAWWFCEPDEIRELVQSPAWCDTPGCPWRPAVGRR